MKTNDEKEDSATGLARQSRNNHGGDELKLELLKPDPEGADAPAHRGHRRREKEAIWRDFYCSVVFISVCSVDQ